MRALTVALHRTLAAILALLTLLAGPTLAQEPGPGLSAVATDTVPADTLPTDTAAQDPITPPPLSAVGLIRRADSERGCTATLIAPDLVLTAAHCRGARGGKGPSPAEAMTFSPTLPDGRPGARYAGLAWMLHPDWGAPVRGGRHSDGALALDIALMRLAEPVPASVAVPVPFGHLDLATHALTLASFRRDSPMRRTRTCPLMGVSDGVLGTACPVRPGESGAPLIAETPDGLRVVAIVTHRTNRTGRDTSLGPVLWEPLTLMLALPAP